MHTKQKAQNWDAQCKCLMFAFGLPTVPVPQFHAIVGELGNAGYQRN